MKIAFFDFDGTLTKHDTFITFARWAVGNVCLLKALLKAFPSLIRWKMGLISNSEAKERLFGCIYGGMDYDIFRKAGETFKDKVNGDIRPDILERLKFHKSQGHRVIIVSASVREWIKPWADANGVDDVISTEVEIDSSRRLTGRFSTRNCHGEEKANRIRELIPEVDKSETWAYGDSHGDDAMLSLADHPNKV